MPLPLLSFLSFQNRQDMGRQPCCDKVGLNKGPWTAEEDKKLINFILANGHCCWRTVPKLAGLLRCGKSCRLRWTNYLRPDLKRGLLSEAEEKLVIDLHSQMGNRWSKIASHLPGRTDNEIKNHWNTHIKKKLRKLGIDPSTHRPFNASAAAAAAAAAVQEEEQVEEKKNNAAAAAGNESDDAGSDAAMSRGASPGFCIDEVPMVHEDEIIQFPCMEWPESTPFCEVDDLGEWDWTMPGQEAAASRIFGSGMLGNFSLSS